MRRLSQTSWQAGLSSIPVSIASVAQRVWVLPLQGINMILLPPTTTVRLSCVYNNTDVLFRSQNGMKRQNDLTKASNLKV
jgi:hypothetical protein